MVFMGSDRYPGEDEFDEFVSSHGGYTNAHTDAEETCYVFEIQVCSWRQRTAHNLVSVVLFSFLLSHFATTRRRTLRTPSTVFLAFSLTLS
jgi:hypothetical protein